jgi:hypothetical protein
MQRWPAVQSVSGACCRCRSVHCWIHCKTQHQDVFSAFELRFQRGSFLIDSEGCTAWTTQQCCCSSQQHKLTSRQKKCPQGYRKASSWRLMWLRQIAQSMWLKLSAKMGCDLCVLPGGGHNSPRGSDMFFSFGDNTLITYLVT